MRKNIGVTDFWIRGFLGLELFFVGLFALGGLAKFGGRLAVLIASILLITALGEYSPIYALLKINTRKRSVDGGILKTPAMNLQVIKEGSKCPDR